MLVATCCKAAGLGNPAGKVLVSFPVDACIIQIGWEATIGLPNNSKIIFLPEKRAKNLDWY